MKLWRVFFVAVGGVTSVMFIVFMLIDSAIKTEVTSKLPQSLEGRVTAVNSDEYREAVMKELVGKYSLNFNYSIEESPWSIAANWVKPREIIPKFSPELGR